MDRTLIVNKRRNSRPTLRLGLLLLIAYGLLTIAFTSWQNIGTLNHALVPVAADWGLFQLIWQDSPLNALLFIANKSLFSLAHLDPRSGLNLWTLEYDSITLLVSLATAMVTSYLLFRAWTAQARWQGVLLSLSGFACVLFSVSYMTHIAHCAGPTWSGFVVAYGLGYENLEFDPYWQIGLATIGLLLLLRAHWVTQRAQMNRLA